MGLETGFFFYSTSLLFLQKCVFCKTKPYRIVCLLKLYTFDRFFIGLLAELVLPWLVLITLPFLSIQITSFRGRIFQQVSLRKG